MYLLNVTLFESLEWRAAYPSMVGALINFLNSAVAASRSGVLVAEVSELPVLLPADNFFSMLFRFRLSSVSFSGESCSVGDIDAIRFCNRIRAVYRSKRNGANFESVARFGNGFLAEF